MQNSKFWLLGIFLLTLMQNALGLTLLQNLDRATELNKLTKEQRTQGRAQIAHMLINCEFAEPCLLKMMDDLTILEKQTHNPMYLVYRNYLRANEGQLKEQLKRCDIPQKQVVRKAVAECLQELLMKETHYKALDRKIIDKLQDEQDYCLKNKMEKLGEEGNLFAQAMLVNIFEQTRETKQLDHWYNEMQKKADTKEYHIYLTCPDIP